jgi:hypothetical protein
MDVDDDPNALTQSQQSLSSSAMNSKQKNAWYSTLANLLMLGMKEDYKFEVGNDFFATCSGYLTTNLTNGPNSYSLIYIVFCSGNA